MMFRKLHYYRGIGRGNETEQNCIVYAVKRPVYFGDHQLGTNMLVCYFFIMIVKLLTNEC
jgi:hypothetical protein